MATTLRRTEAKAFFANERTFLHWMNMSVTLGSISAALLGKCGWEGRVIGLEPLNLALALLSSIPLSPLSPLSPNNQASQASPTSRGAGRTRATPPSCAPSRPR